MTTKKKDIDSALSFLYTLHTFGIKLGLENINSLLRFLNHPEKKFPTIHIAGTNGKGSTSSMIAAILTAAGYSVGLYTSPHIQKFNERIRINGIMITDEDVALYTELMKHKIQKQHATFFEATTAMALQYFADKKVDIAVIETGLGGRLDSTNVITPIVSVITTIGKDHIQQLGNSLSKIALEKAGIIKPKIPVVVGNINGVALTTIKKAAHERNAKLIQSQKEISDSVVEQYSVELAGKHQIDNVKTVLTVITILQKKYNICEKNIFLGLANTTALAGFRGRFQKLRINNKNLIIDVAHNLDGTKVLVEEIKKQQYRKLFVIFGVMKDKNYKEMLAELGTLNPILIAAQPNTDRALSVLEIMFECNKLQLQCIVSNNTKDAVGIALKRATQKDLILAVGSFYLAGEVFDALESS